MIFAHAWVLALLVLPAAWFLWEWRSTQRRVGLAMKCLATAAAIGALSEPVVDFRENRVALAVAVDTSASVTGEDLANASELLNGMERQRGRNTVRVLPFARKTRNAANNERNGSRWNLRPTAGDAARGTDLEAAIREAISTLPPNAVRRVALITDGNENMGSVTRASWQAQQLGIPVDTFAMKGRLKPELGVTSVSVPGQVFSGEHFPVDLVVSAPQAGAGKVELTADGRNLGSTPVQLEAGENRIRVRASLNAVGAIDLAGSVSEAGATGTGRFEEAIAVRRPRALLFSSDPPESEVHLSNTLVANQFEVVRADRLPADLSGFQLILYNNWNLEAIPEADQERVERFEQQGGGVLWIAGERNVYIDRKDAPEPPLARALPARLAPPRSPEGTAVVLIIDKSSSMEGKKIELARLAAIGVVDNLRPIDYVAVLIFDNSFQWAVPVRKVEDKSLIKRLISGITPDGGTQIAPALAEAYRKILPLNTVYKHVVLLTDGISEEGDSMALSREAANNKVTISTVGLGQDVNRAYLEKIASFAKGKSYFLNDPSGLEQILLKDVQEHTGTSAVEKTMRVRVERPAEVLDKTGMESAPALKGYVRYETRPTAEEILGADVKDPLFVRWQNGLGRAAVFTSDAKSRWAADWIGWPGYDRFWSNVLRDLLPHASAAEANAEFDPASEELVVRYRLASQLEEPDKTPDIFALGPGNFRQPLKVAKVAGGEYRGHIKIGATEGLFRVRPLEESRAFPEVGLYRPEAELADFGSNEFLLKEIAQATGGRFQPSLKQLFESGGRSEPSSLRLWPALLGLAILLHLSELIQRKWGGILSALRPGRSGPAAERAA